MESEYERRKMEERYEGRIYFSSSSTGISLMDNNGERTIPPYTPQTPLEIKAKDPIDV